MSILIFQGEWETSLWRETYPGIHFQWNLLINVFPKLVPNTMLYVCMKYVYFNDKDSSRITIVVIFSDKK